MPVWAICAPWRRVSLEKIDRLFFIPQKGPLIEAGLEDYIFTGLLVVRERVEEPNEMFERGVLDSKYADWYLRDLRKHLRDDWKGNEWFQKIGPKNMILGEKYPDSIWFGRNGRPVSPILERLGLHHCLRRLRMGLNQYIPALETEDCMTLDSELRHDI